MFICPLYSLPIDEIIEFSRVIIITVHIIDGFFFHSLKISL